jgi:hypothetical protein
LQPTEDQSFKTPPNNETNISHPIDTISEMNYPESSHFNPTNETSNNFSRSFQKWKTDIDQCKNSFQNLMNFFSEVDGLYL